MVSAAARRAGPVLDQLHVRLLFQKMLLRRLYDAVGHDRDPHLHPEKRWTGRREYAVSNQRGLFDVAPRR